MEGRRLMAGDMMMPGPQDGVVGHHASHPGVDMHHPVQELVTVGEVHTVQRAEMLGEGQPEVGHPEVGQFDVGLSEPGSDRGDPAQHDPAQHDHAQHDPAQHAATGRYVGGHHAEWLPNFAHLDNLANRRLTHTSVDGTWSEVVGQTDRHDVVAIGSRVILSGDVTAHSIVVMPGGELRFARGADTNLDIVNLQVLTGGSLDIGTADDPIVTSDVRITFADVPHDHAIDPAEFGRGLIVQGNVSIHGRNLESTFAAAADDIVAGQTEIVTTHRASDWRPGDRVLIPDTRQLGYTDNLSTGLDQYDIATVADIRGDALSLSTEVRHDHAGAVDASGRSVARPYVANLSRNIVFESANPIDGRGHVLMTGRATVDIVGAEFRDLGRTTNQDVDDAMVNADGHRHGGGTNQAGRYAVHFHHVIGPAVTDEGHAASGPMSPPPQFRFEGNSVWNSGQTISKWAIVLHGSHHGRIADNVVYHYDGAGIVTEDGSEYRNTIDGNFVSRIDGNRTRGKFSDGREGSGIWLRRPASFVDNNVITGAVKAGIAIYGSENTLPPPAKVPAFIGADPHAGDSITIDADTMHLQSFVGNEVFASSVGVEFWYYKFQSYHRPSSHEVAETVAKDLLLWNNSSMGLVGFQVNHLTIADAVIVGDVDRIGRYNLGRGVVLESAVQTQIVDSTIANYSLGVLAPLRVADLDPTIAIERIDPFEIRGGHLDNQTDVLIQTPTQDAFREFAPRRIAIRDVRFADELSGRIDGATQDIRLESLTGRFSNMIAEDRIELFGYGPEAGDYRLYYAEQSPQWIVPMTGSSSAAGGGSPLAAPVGGLTNAELWASHAMAVAGAVAPGGPDHFAAADLPSVDAMAFALSGDLPPSIESVGSDRWDLDRSVTAGQPVAVPAGNGSITGRTAPSTDVVVRRDGIEFGRVRADAAGHWQIDIGASREFESTWTAENARGSTATPTTNGLTLLTRRHAPQIAAAEYQIGHRAVAGTVIGQLSWHDADAGDTAVVQPLGDFDPPVGVDAVGQMVLARSLDASIGSSIDVPVSVIDTAGNRTDTVVRVDVVQSPPADWVPLLDREAFSSLTAAEVPYLTQSQIQRLGSAYHLERIGREARAALTPQQIGWLPVESPGTIGVLSPAQREFLTSSQVDRLPVTDLADLPASRIGFVSPGQIELLSNGFALFAWSRDAVAALSAAQVRSLPTEHPYVVQQLTPDQKRMLTAEQIRRVPADDLRHLDSVNMASVAASQLSTIASLYHYHRIPEPLRSQFTDEQLAGLTFDID